MAKIDDLVIQIKADTKQLKAELDKINGKIKVTGATGGAAFGGMAAGLSKIKGPAIAAAAGIAAIVLPLKAAAGAGSQFEDLKDSLDSVFGSITAGDAAMQKIFTFAQTTPFQIEDATKAFIALKSAGIEPSMDMLQTFADTASVSVDQLGTFEALIRMVQRSASGGMGLEELNMISDRGIDVLGILGEKLNLGKDDIAEFGKTAEGAAEMVKALTEGLQEKFGGAMESKMDNLSTKASNMVIAFKQLGDEVFKSGLGDFLKDTADFLAKIANESARIVRTVTGTKTIEDFAPEVDMSKSTPEQKRALAQDFLADANEELNKAQRNLASAEENFTGDALMAYQARVNGAQKRVDNLIEIIASFNKQIAEAQKPKEVDNTFDAGNIDGLIEFLPKFKKLVEDAVPETKKLGDQIKFLEDLMATGDKEQLAGIMGFLGVKDVSEIKAVIEHLQKLQDELDETATFSSEMQTAIISASQAFTSDFVSSLMDGENALDSFKNFAKNIVNQIITIFLQMAVVNEILNSVFNLTGKSALPTLRNTKAGGGKVQAGSPVLVGERGMEMFVPDTGGRIMNNMNTKNSMGGAPIIVNQSVNFATGVVPTVRAEVTKMMPQIADVTKGAVAEAAMRGGNFRRALQGG
jgi:uncharacterized protein YukE